VIRQRRVTRRHLLMATSLALGPRKVARGETRTMRHVVLLGDSIFENAAYVGTAPDVRKQLKEMMRRDDRVPAHYHSSIKGSAH
jgi:hypothetical protein